MKTKAILTPFFVRLAQSSSSVRLAHFILRTNRALAGAVPLDVCAVEWTEHHAPAGARESQLIVQVSVLLCAATALVGCASTKHQVSPAAYDDSQPPEVAAPLTPPLPRQAVLDKSAFRKPDLDVDRAITLDEWEQFDKSAAFWDNFQSLDESSDGQINVTEFLTQAPKHSKRHHLLGGTDKTDDGLVSTDREVFQNPGWHLFSFDF